MTSDGAPHKVRAQGWLAKALRRRYLLGFILFDLSLTLTIIVLKVISSRYHGFATVPNKDSNLGSSNEQTNPVEESSRSWNLGILWTALPSVVFQLFATYWTWISEAVAERQPYVELRNGADAERSIFLDYRAIPVLWRWWRAFRLGHIIIGTILLLDLTLRFVVTPFSSFLFTTQLVVLQKEASVSFPSGFNDSKLNDLLDWRPVLGTVAATLVYNGSNIPWTDEKSAFRPFAVETLPTSGRFNVTANTTGFSAYVSCELIDDYSLSLNPLDHGSGRLSITGSDRGCEFDESFTVMEGPEMYFEGKSQTSCSAHARFGRLVFMVGAYSSSSQYLLDPINVISCATQYQAVSGLLEVTLTPPSNTPAVCSFTKTGEPDTTRASQWRVVEFGMLAPVVFNPGKPWSTSDFGSTVLNYAKKIAPADPLSPEALKNAISRVFTTAYLTAVATHAFDPLVAEEAAPGTLLTPTTRLYVVGWVANFVLAFLVLTLLFLCWVFGYVRNTHSILTEEPKGLLGMAGLITRSDNIKSFVEDTMKPFQHDSRVLKAANDSEKMTKTYWRASKKDNAGVWVIEKTNKDGQPCKAASPKDNPGMNGSGRIIA